MKNYPSYTARRVYDWNKEPLVFDVHRTALLLDVTEKTVKTWLQTGQLQGVKIGRKWLIDREYLRNLLQGTCQGVA